MDRFDRFGELPDDVQLNVWRYAASVPRVVSVFERHTSNDILAPDEQRSKAMVMSKTRPPAVLGVCQESRSTTLEIYRAMDGRIWTRGELCDIPVHVIPEVDAVLRGKKACRSGLAFSHRVDD
jgi:hypothetical protein